MIGKKKQITLLEEISLGNDTKSNRKKVGEIVMEIV